MMNTTRLISYRELISSGAWPVTRCLREVAPESSDDYFFVSHPWLSKEHPDPEGVKWRVLAGWWRRLESLRDELLQTDPAGLGREEQKRWIERRFGAAPVAAKSHYNQWDGRLFGWEWAAFGGTGDDPRRASTEFHGWLLASIDGVLDGHLWIDSHATAPKSHRDDVMGALLSLEGGRYLMLTATWNVFGVIRSEMYRRGVPVADFGDLITHLQACLYVCICRTRLEPREAARTAVRHWQDRTDIRLFPLTSGRCFFGLRREHAAGELAQMIDRVYAFWSGSSDGTIDIYVQDFCPTLKAS